MRALCTFGTNHQMKTVTNCLTALTLLAAPMAAIAGLVAVPGGQLVNDTDHNITWTADGNLFLTQAAQSGNATALVAAIISNWGMPFVSPNFNNGVSYSLTAADFDTSGGGMTWFGAIAWVNYLNVTNYQGYSDWRLPNIGPAGTNPGICGGACYPSTSGEPISSSEWWELFFTELGGVQRTPIQTTHNSSYLLFTNMLGGGWGGNGQPLDLANDFTDLANTFGADSGQQRAFTNNMTFAWIVRPGLSVTSPPPMAHLVLAPAGMLSYGKQKIGTVSPTQTIMVKNTGTGAANFTVAASGDFAQTNNCSASLAPGTTCTIGVTFNPTAVDARIGTLTVTAGAAYTIALSGTGTIKVTITPSASTVTVGVPVTLAWTSSPGAVCFAETATAGDGWVGSSLPSNGALSVTESAAGTYTYSLRCNQGLQGDIGQAVVTDTVPTVSLSAQPTNLTVGQPTTLTWTSSNAAMCMASSNGAGDGWSGTKALSDISPVTQNTPGLITYTLTCTSGPQSAQSSVQVFYNAKPSSGGGGQMSLLSLFLLLGSCGLRMVRVGDSPNSLSESIV